MLFSVFCLNCVIGCEYVPYILHQDQGFIFHFVILKIWLIFSKKLVEFLTRKTVFPKKNPFFLSKRATKTVIRMQATIVQDIQICMPMDHIDCLLSLTSAKQRSTVLEKNSTFDLGYIYIIISETFSISLTVGLTLRKIL